MGKFQMAKMPTEVIEHCAHYLDTKALLQFATVSQRMRQLIYAENNALPLYWLRACYQDPTIKTLIQAANISEDLKSFKINARLFFNSVTSKDVESLKKLLLPTNLRRFEVYVACYETSIPDNFSFFACARKVFLTQDIGAKNTWNIRNVTSWIKVKIPVDEKIFEQLFNDGYAVYANRIPHNDIIRPKEKEKTSCLIM